MNDKSLLDSFVINFFYGLIGGAFAEFSGRIIKAAFNFERIGSATGLALGSTVVVYFDTLGNQVQKTIN